MKNKTQTQELINFYKDNEITEIFFEKKQNHFLTKDNNNNKKSLKTNSNQSQSITINKSNINQNTQSSTPKTTTNDQVIKPVFSTDHALANLAKKNQYLLADNSVQEKFMALDEIIKMAKDLAQSAKTLTQLREIVENFDGCNLKKMATKTVFSDGNPNSEIMVIGEAPGNHEDLQGIPFCGDSGMMLSDMFRAINLSRKDHYYITNVIFWRPPGNRRPTDEELAICRPFLERHLELFKPKIIILVGATAMSAILGDDQTISSLRGQIINFAPPYLSFETKTLTIFHPSFLMRQSAKKKLAWQDMLTLENFLKNKF